ncbi:hypothetical protein [Bosea sp. BK604]|uniref:hypothetical protein n=1 Tax=Bosea sp. BK604 TaxID=2512180 RepID=UPI0010460C69|nr:hypothetical protein [Bosea sp. BK604]TCR64645.1 hypothetical protein EV560_106109 [Bosea sp. BK604]
MIALDDDFADLVMHAFSSRAGDSRTQLPPRHPVTIRREPDGYGIRFGLSEEEDELLHGPSFETLPEALAWVDAFDEARSA